MTDKNFNNLICNRIKFLRQSQGLTSEQLAYRSGISKGGLSEIERCLKEPRLYTVLKICAGLEISMQEFFNFKEIDEFMNLL